MFPENQIDKNIRYQRFLPYYYNDNPRIDYCKAGVAIEDISEGFDFQLWKCRLYKNGNITISPESSNYNDETLIINFENARKVSLAFDNEMRPVLCVLADGNMLLRYYKESESDFVTIIYENVRDGVVRIDNVSQDADSYRSVIVSYIYDTNFYYFLSDDEYSTIYTIQNDVHEWQRIFNCGMTENNRFQFSLIWDHKLIGAC